MPYHIIYTTLQGASRADADACRAWVETLYRSERRELLALLMALLMALPDGGEGEQQGERERRALAEWVESHRGAGRWALAMRAQAR